MTKYLLSIDPGKSSGVALLGYTENDPAWLVDAWQFGGGLAGFKDWIDNNPDTYPSFASGGGNTVTICEKFQPINHSDYALTTDSVEPLRIEGLLYVLGMMPDYSKEEKRWRRPADQYLFGGQGKARKKQMQHQWLKENGFYVTGKQFGTPDADDARSAISHGISYIVKELHHKPTFNLVSRVELR